MGKGLALLIKEAYPENFKYYAKACRLGKVFPGEMLVWQNKQTTTPNYIVNFPTKRHWQNNSLIEDIDAGLSGLVETIHEYDIRSIAIPPLGCGNGGLDWNIVKPKIVNALNHLTDVKIFIYEPIKN